MSIIVYIECGLKSLRGSEHMTISVGLEGGLNGNWRKKSLHAVITALS